MYILALAPSDHSVNEFNKICNMLSEYSSPEKAEASVLAFLEEHCDIIVSADAVQKLSAL
jgi:adapter protein MecA 1/2